MRNPIRRHSLLILALASSQVGCSILAVRGPPDDQARSFECSRDTAWPYIDAAAAVAYPVGGLVAAAYQMEGGSAVGAAERRSDALMTAGGALITGALFGVSSWVGFTRQASCRKAVARWEARVPELEVASARTVRPAESSARGLPYWGTRAQAFDAAVRACEHLKLQVERKEPTSFSLTTQPFPTSGAPGDAEWRSMRFSVQALASSIEVRPQVEIHRSDIRGSPSTSTPHEGNEYWKSHREIDAEHRALLETAGVRGPGRGGEAPSLAEVLTGLEAAFLNSLVERIAFELPPPEPAPDATPVRVFDTIKPAPRVPQ